VQVNADGNGNIAIKKPAVIRIVRSLHKVGVAFLRVSSDRI
jgi:hypothetical protein